VKKVREKNILQVLHPLNTGQSVPQIWDKKRQKKRDANIYTICQKKEEIENDSGKDSRHKREN